MTRKRYSEKLKSVIAHYNCIKVFRDGWFIISFIRVPGKMAKTLKPILKGGEGKCRMTQLR